MNCPVCKAENAATAKFCNECGIRLEFLCPYCTAPTAAGAKFCNECGSSLDFRCAQCSAVNRPGSKFCQACGVRLLTQCFSCGSITPPGARFCQQCGGRLERRCTTCGTPIVFEAHFCNGCGTALDNGDIATVATPLPLVRLPSRPAPAAPPTPNEQPAMRTPVVPPAPPVQPVPAAPVARHLEVAPLLPVELPPIEAPPASVVAATPAPLAFEQLPPPEPPVVEASPLAPEDERRLVTVLFGDVSGFTAMAEKLDPEEVKLIMDRCLKQLADQIFKFEGNVDKFEGDLIMAVFGAPVSHEDDAERAVLAALDMQKAMAEFSADLQRRRGFSLEARIGINTGEVISGIVAGGREKDYTVMGDVVNTASRLEGAAAPGTILVGDKTYQLTKHLIDFDVLEPITVKGKTEPLPVYTAKGVRADRGLRRGVVGLESPMVGRNTQLMTLLSSFQQMTLNHQPHMVTILGVPGIGKSRLLAEYELSLKLGGNAFTWCKGRCVPYGQGITFYPLAEILKGFLGIKESDSLEFVKLRLLDGIADVIRQAHTENTEAEIREEARQIAHRLGYAIGVTYPEADLEAINPANLKDEMFWAWLRFLSMWSAIQPLVFVLEDIHWADPVVLDLVQSIERSLEGASIQFLCLSRPEVLDSRSNWLDGPNTQVIQVEPLTLEQSMELVDNLLAPNILSYAWKERVSTAAGGVPFFLEEFVRTVIEDEQILQGPAGWGPRVSERLPDLPDSIFATLYARLDRLPASEKTLLQRASVVGNIFWESALRFPAPILGADAVAVGRLQVKGWLRQHDDSAFVNDAEYEFVNYMVRESAYKGQTRSRRSHEHNRVAQWLEARVGDRVEEFIEQLAYHYGQGALQAIEDDDGDTAPLLKAISYGRRAAVRAKLHHANPDALTRYSDTLQLLERFSASDKGATMIDGVDLSTLRLGLLLDRAQVLEPLGRYDDALADIELMQSEANLQHSVPMQAAAFAYKARLLRLQAQPDAAIECAQRAIRLHRQTHDRKGEAEALIVLGEIRSDRAELEQFESAMRQAVELAQASGVVWLQAKAMTLLGSACIMQGKMAAASEQLSAAAQLNRGIGDRRGTAQSYLMLGRVEHATGNSPDAIAHVEDAYASFHEIGDQPMRVASLVTLGQLHLERGNLSPCRLYSQTALELAKTLGQHAQAVRATLSLAQAELAEGVSDGLIPQLLDAQKQCEEMHQTAILPEVYRMLAQVHIALGDPIEGERYARMGRDVVEADDHYSQGTTWFALSLALAAQDGRTEEAEDAFRHALHDLEESEETFEIGDGHLAYAAFLIVNGRSREAVYHLDRAHHAFDSLGTRDRLSRIDALRERLEDGPPPKPEAAGVGVLDPSTPH